MKFLKPDKEIFDFAAMVATTFTKDEMKVADVISMYGLFSKKKYSLRLVKKTKQIILLTPSPNYNILMNPDIAKHFSGETITNAIIWASIRPDYEDGINGDIQADGEAVDILCKYHTGFDKTKFIEEFDKLVSPNGNNTYRVKLAKAYLDSKP